MTDPRIDTSAAAPEQGDGFKSDGASNPSSEDAASLHALMSRAVTTGRMPAPVDRWQPDHEADIGLAIEADGRWTYQGRPITRQRMVRLFSTILRREENGSYHLVTPVEKVAVAVADAPFVAVEMAVSNVGGARKLTFLTNVGDTVDAGPDHGLRFVTQPDGGIKPYVHIRGRLEALLTRALTHDLLLLGEEVGDDFVVRSGGECFVVSSLDALEGETSR